MRQFNDLALRALRTADEEHLTALHGSPPISVFKELRQFHDLSLADLARRSYLSKNTLVRAENATYANPLPSLMDYWVKNSKRAVTYLDLVTGYEDFQDEQRRRHTKYFGLDLHINETSTTHPLRQLRSSRYSYSNPDRSLPVGIDEVSRALCLPPDTLRFWEKKWRQQQTVPKLFNSVLLFVGYSGDNVLHFNYQYEQWRRETLNKERELVANG